MEEIGSSQQPIDHIENESQLIFYTPMKTIGLPLVPAPGTGFAFLAILEF
jgi:hypothetical protein